QAQTESMTARRRKNPPGLVDRKHLFLAKDIAVLGQLILPDAGQHFVDDQLDISSSSRFVLFRNIVRAQTSWHVLKRRDLAQALDGVENLQLVFEREPVTRFRFDRSCATSQKPVGVSSAGLDQLVQRRRARLCDRRLDTAAAGGNLLIAGSAG